MQASSVGRMKERSAVAGVALCISSPVAHGLPKRSRLDARAAKEINMYHLVRGFQRGLEVLVALNRVGEASVIRLSAETQLPRPTVNRFLETLRALGFVDRSHKRDAYRLASKVTSLSSGYRPSDRLTESAEPVLAEVGNTLRWPIDVLAYEDAFMVVRATTHRESPLSVHRIAPGSRVPVLSTASGQAYLAYCSAAERKKIMRELTAECALSESQISQLVSRLDDVRARGYATRRKTAKQRTSSISVPILVSRRVVGCISAIWFDSALTQQAAATQMLPSLLDAATKIASRFRALSR
jgi:IclR family transcriptional regulator, mhp operon transcriptional activator